jgi:hypothetical protein
MGCASRLGCLTFGVLLGVLAIAVLLVTRPAGPGFHDGVYTYDVGGRPREVAITREAAASFREKLNGELPPTALLEAVTIGVPVTEAELNSRVAEELALRPIEGHGAAVERVFIRLASSGATAYVYTTVGGVEVVMSSDLVFRLERGRADVELRNPQAGRLPVGFALPATLALLSDLTGIEQTIALVIPAQVREIRHEEGRLRVLLNPLAGVPAPPEATTSVRKDPPRSAP